MPTFTIVVSSRARTGPSASTTPVLIRPGGNGSGLVDRAAPNPLFLATETVMRPPQARSSAAAPAARGRT
ncbi:hypothetical protein ACFWXO_22515 [Kitasatospora sp. NPDC059088]|uniref:hypothetical protein n=1 Tax=Kitasatospora sp. NPDC059088 TaxID=3346722 RepID=UPI0036CF097E